MSASSARADRLALDIRDRGLADYKTVLQEQLALNADRREGRIGDTVLIVEHPPVITLGARKSANMLIPEVLESSEVEIVEVRRGGGSTAHNPGQIVFYPILNLSRLGLGINPYVRRLEQVGIELLAGLGVQAVRHKGLPGLWVRQRKIASIGVRVSRFITYHGMAINIQNDLGIFDLIVPCGLEGVEMTSVLKETGRSFDMAEVKQKLSELLQEHLVIHDQQR